MRFNRRLILGFTFICTLLGALLLAQGALAQNDHSECDVEHVIEHQNEHAQELANFAEEAKTDLHAALATLYRTAIAYQALAIECGFTDTAVVESAHELEHADFNSDSDAHVDDPEAEAAALALARTVGDPEQGKILFNTIRPEVSFACATCHRVDSTETLVGPGLFGISGHVHEHDAAAPDSHDTHDAAGEATAVSTDAMSGMNMGGATAVPTEANAMSGMNMGQATVAPTDTHDAMSGMNMGESTAEATAAPERTFEETVEFLRTSITNPSASVMTGFPDNLMPKVYGTIFTPEQINDLIAYLLTLK